VTSAVERARRTPASHRSSGSDRPRQTCSAVSRSTASGVSASAATCGRRTKARRSPASSDAGSVLVNSHHSASTSSARVGVYWATLSRATLYWAILSWAIDIVGTSTASIGGGRDGRASAG
jgi:hypothetical protein